MNISTTTISAIDLIGFSQNIAQLNLGYLAIAVTILGVLGGVFVYFNLRPLKDALDKQERAIETLKKEAQDLLSESAKETEKLLAGFKKNQLDELALAFTQQEDNLKLEVANTIHVTEKNLLDKIEDISESKDIKLREVTVSEVSNSLSSLEKNLTSKISTNKEEVGKELLEAKRVSDRLKESIKELGKKIRELEIYKYDNEGKRGAIIGTIELLAESIDEYFANIEKLGRDESMIRVFSYEPIRMIRKLDALLIKFQPEKEDIVQISEQITRIDKESVFKDVLDNLKSRIKVQ